LRVENLKSPVNPETAGGILNNQCSILNRKKRDSHFWKSLFSFTGKRYKPVVEEPQYER
jgi:hypothetical protein